MKARIRFEAKGRSARSRGLPLSANPLVWDTPLGWAWGRGWFDQVGALKLKNKPATAAKDTAP